MQQLTGIRTGVVDRSPVTHTIRLLGRVAPNENRTYVLNAAVDGWIRDVEPFSTGSLVEKDQPLATFYSKDFVPAQQNYFSALTTLDRLQKSQFSTPEQITLTNVQVWSQEDALQNLGMGETQIKEIAAKRQYVRDVVIRSPDKGLSWKETSPRHSDSSAGTCCIGSRISPKSGFSRTCFKERQGIFTLASSL